MKRPVFPFSALVEQAALKAALLLNAVDPLIGGVLIRGQKGTGKSTAARALATLLPEIEVVAGCPFNSDPRAPFTPPESDLLQPAPATGHSVARRLMPFVELPLNATEDRLAGTLHFERTLQQGRRQFEPGLLAAANRGVLYVDEVNLLDDHLVDLLLDAAASGVNVVEREGLSFAHPARFLLIGTMNPEEGELRPQFLDRYGLCLTLDRITSPSARELIIRRRLDFDRDPQGFARQWQEADRLAAAQVVLARSRLEDVSVPDEQLALVSRLSHQLEVAGHRADIAIVKAARAHAAFLERDQTTLDDLAIAARLVLPHRIPASPLDSTDQLQDRIGAAFRQISAQTAPADSDANANSPETTAPEAEDLEGMAEKMQIPGNCAAGSVLLSFLKKKTVKPSLKPTSA